MIFGLTMNDLPAGYAVLGGRRHLLRVDRRAGACVAIVKAVAVVSFELIDF
jgi:hypothetical protein